jgi:phosphoglycerate dehydrogenase-like enzyme
VRIVITDDWEGAALSCADWSVLGDGVTIDVLPEHLPPDELAVQLRGAEVVVAMRERTRWDDALLSRLPELRLLVTTGAANAAIDTAACAARGITVCGTGSHPGGTAELTWALILAAARRLDEVLPAMAEGWPSRVGTALHGRTLGLLGLGRVGGVVARVGAAFGMDVVAWTPTLDHERAAAVGARAATRAEVISSAHFLSLHLPLSPATRGAFSREDIRALRPDAWLVNTARAGLVDETALREALDARAIAGAAMDVFAVEPLPADSPWRGRDDVILTPHLGYVSDVGMRTWFGDAIEDIAAWREGRPIRVIVDAS